ncbi:hypothetical protein SAY86_015650 [Trapa natans]|uniref:Uncharacterized protein n=1 Tax=Trapa natans TaxID=22666 RepID=A0AAN7R0F5_TRANT|nr:hypothetical protein SAY86_015650 [Trapa natans]
MGLMAAQSTVPSSFKLTKGNNAFTTLLLLYTHFCMFVLSSLYLSLLIDGGELSLSLSYRDSLRFIRDYPLSHLPSPFCASRRGMISLIVAVLILAISGHSGEFLTLNALRFASGRCPFSFFFQFRGSRASCCFVPIEEEYHKCIPSLSVHGLHFKRSPEAAWFLLRFLFYIFFCLYICIFFSGKNCFHEKGENFSWGLKKSK